MKEGLAMLRSLSSGEERRDLVLSDAGVSVQDVASSESRRFVGHAAVFNKRAAIGNPRTWGFYEQIAPGAFSKTLAEADARMLVDHNPAMVVSRSSAGTLQLSQDAYGLRVDSVLDTELSYVSDLVRNLQNGNITGMSFGFQVVKDDWTTEEERSADGEPVEVEVRTVREIKLIEVSAVTFPAYEETDAGLRHSLVPALRHRGDVDAIARAVRAKPELGELLGVEPEPARPQVNVRVDGKLIDTVVGEVLGNDTPIVADGDAMVPVEQRDPKKPYGNVTYADPGYQEDGVHRYPIDTEAHAKAAWSYINQADNASKYTSEQLAAIKSRIRAALKKFGVKVSDEQNSSTEPAETTQQLEQHDDETSEPAASTRNAPSQHELAKAQLRALKARLRSVA